MRLEHHSVGGYVRYISPYIIIIIKCTQAYYCNGTVPSTPTYILRSEYLK